MTAAQADAFRAAVAAAPHAPAVVIQQPGYTLALDLDLLARLDGVEAAANAADDAPSLFAFVRLRAEAIARLHAAG